MNKVRIYCHEPGCTARSQIVTAEYFTRSYFEENSGQVRLPCGHLTKCNMSIPVTAPSSGMVIEVIYDK
jgi:hypothetical protein